MARKPPTHLARKLRREPSDAEKRLWSRLRGRQLGVQFVRQFRIGDYIADLACRRARLIIAVDGGQHADSDADIQRTREIEAHGYTVIRFWNNEVLGNTDGVVMAIAEALAIARNRNSWFEDEPG